MLTLSMSMIERSCQATSETGSHFDLLSYSAGEKSGGEGRETQVGHMLNFLLHFHLVYPFSLPFMKRVLQINQIKTFGAKDSVL